VFLSHLPEDIQKYKIAKDNINQLEVLSSRFGEYPTKWFNRANKILSNSKNNH
jgi:hypothetical protein